MTNRFHPNQELNRGFEYQAQMLNVFEALQNNPIDETNLIALQHIVESFRHEIVADTARVPDDGHHPFKNGFKGRSYPIHSTPPKC